MTIVDIITVVVCGVFGFGLVWLLISAAQRFLSEKAGTRSDDAGNELSTPETQDDARSWHEVLGVDEGCSLDEIRQAYQSLIQQHQPDRVAPLGPEFVGVAEQRAKEINDAYQRALSLRQGQD